MQFIIYLYLISWYDYLYIFLMFQSISQINLLFKKLFKKTNSTTYKILRFF